MDETTATMLNLWIQSAVAVAAVLAAVIALVVGAQDRKNARVIAAEDRRAALEHAKHMYDLDALVRLARNIERAGHENPQVSRDMQAEAAAILHLLGPQRLPKTWADKRGSTLEEAREYGERDDIPAYKRHAVEVHLELDRTAREIEALISRR